MQIPVNFLRVLWSITRMLATRAARRGLCSLPCATRRAEPCARLVAISAARGLAPPCPERVWSPQTDSQRLAAAREGPKGAFRATYARFAGGRRGTESRVAVRAAAGEHPKR